MREHARRHGGRILVAEDIFMIAESVCDLLYESGFLAVGPVATVEKGCRLAQSEALDGAVLSLKLNDEFCTPICGILAARRIPFIFMSGYPNLSLLPVEFRSMSRLPKPFDPDELRIALNRMLETAS